MNIFGKNWDNPISHERLELVFRERNQNYGAYVIRRDYSSTVLKAFLITCTSIVLLASIPSLLAYFYPEKRGTTERIREVIVELADATIPEKIIPEKVEPATTPKQPAGQTQQFTTPIVSDKDTSGDMKTQDLLSTTLIGTKTNKSDSTDTKDPLPFTNNNGNGTTKTMTWAEVMPSFPGGESAMLKYLSTHINYPATARENNVTGIVYLSFVVNTEGEITDLKTLRGIGSGCEEEAMRVIQSMPKWSAGIQNGQPVNVQYNLPISFRLK